MYVYIHTCTYIYIYIHIHLEGHLVALLGVEQRQEEVPLKIEQVENTHGDTQTHTYVLNKNSSKEVVVDLSLLTSFIREKVVLPLCKDLNVFDRVYPHALLCLCVCVCVCACRCVCVCVCVCCVCVYVRVCVIE
jgi:hypothetical protein